MSWKSTLVKRIISFLKHKWGSLSKTKQYLIQQIVDGVMWDLFEKAFEGILWVLDQLKNLLNAASEWLVNKIAYIMGA